MFFFFNYTAPTVIYTTDTRFPDTTLFRSNGRARRRRRGGRSPARPGRPLMHVVATAGHVDHGKSTLVLHLTGTDPDRLAEEKVRGLTIDLGFAGATLPSGRRMAMIDVPGHVRFLKNMLAGMGAVDACLFVVAAREGGKPQSARSEERRVGKRGGRE